LVEEGTRGDPDFDAYAKDFDNLPFHRFLRLTLEERRPGFARICLHKTADTPTGIGGSVHGGILAAMVDIVMLAAIFAERRPGEVPAGTADLNISYLRPAQGERIFADAAVVKRGRQLAMIEVSIVDEADRLCARGRVLYAFRAQPN
jgi:uncharacterized protein (TIGR00369 family)